MYDVVSWAMFWGRWVAESYAHVLVFIFSYSQALLIRPHVLVIFPQILSKYCHEAPAHVWFDFLIFLARFISPLFWTQFH